jgi:SAM-dependent methyltransferase
MLVKLFTLLCRNPSFRRRFWKLFYERLASSEPEADWSFMNFGYHPLTPKEKIPDIKPGDVRECYAVQLYHHVTQYVELKGLRVLELGSGRGGGSAYIKRYLHPRLVVGVDYSTRAVALCSHRHSLERLYFMPGDAESLPFKDGTFDAVVNVESSHCYGSMEVFLREAARVLRPGGYFLFADFRASEEVEPLRRLLQNAEMALLQEKDITANVIESSHRDSQRRLKLIEDRVPRAAVKSFEEFAGVAGSRIYAGFCAGEVKYLSFVLRKTEHGEAQVS